MKSIKTDYPNSSVWRNEKGEIHREDGPAVEHDNGDKSWYQHDQFHREDGPAIEDADGTKVWYLHGEHIDCQSQEEFERLVKLKAFW